MGVHFFFFFKGATAVLASLSLPPSLSLSPGSDYTPDR